MGKQSKKSSVAIGAMNGNFSMKNRIEKGSSQGTNRRNVCGGSSEGVNGGMSTSLHHDWIEDAGPHREMAVDVPDTFVGRTKTHPRYPPSKQTSRFGLRKKEAQTAMLQTTAAGEPAPPPRDHLKIKKDGRLVLLHQGSQVPNEETKLSSLCGSRKFQAFKESSTKLPSSGIVNTTYNYRDEEDNIEEEFNESDPGFSISAGLSSNRASALVPKNKNLLNSEIKTIVGLEDVTAALQRVQEQLKKNGHASQGVEAELKAVQNLLLSPAFHSALSIHSKVQEVWCSREPVLPSHFNVQQLVSECLTSLQQGQCVELFEAVELVSLLSSFEVGGLLYAYDLIAEESTISTTPLSDGHHEDLRDYFFRDFSKTIPESSSISCTSPTSHSLACSASSSSQPSDGIFKIIRLEKFNEPLGATVMKDGESIVVGRIMRGGVADRSGLLHECDEILEINGVEVYGKSVKDVCDLVGSLTGIITFLIAPVGAGQISVTKLPSGQVWPSVVHLKAHFDYNPEDDLYIPCKELGISFIKGDILHVISQEDPSWWQAFREGEDDRTFSGLIPSKSFQKRREMVKQSMLIDTVKNEITITRESKVETSLSARKHHKKKRSTTFPSNYEKDEDEEIPTYEEVGLYYPRSNHKRPIVLISPPNVGQKELSEMILQDSERFAPAIPHTSRPKKDTEINSKDYHFITRLQFEADIANRLFVEYGKYEKSYYGTKLDAIWAVVHAGKFCVLNLHPQSLKILKDSDLMPFVVFVAPPSLEKLRAKKKEKGEAVKDDDLKDIIEKAWEMEEIYGHYFDMVIVNGDEDRTYSLLLSEVNRLEREPQWVPAIWLDRNGYK